MKNLCGCCEGIRTRTPATHHNRPGLSALSYRAGTHSTFLETMKARLSTMELPSADDGTTPGKRPLLALTTRDQSDPAIALLDAWATVGDILTFYQERLANEGYLLTATERQSILELARLIGYRLRPGVAASVFLAYTLEPDYTVEIPVGAQVQSVPGPGELPQAFETGDKFIARAEWNTLKPRLTRPQIITGGTSLGTSAANRETLYFQGTNTKLSAGDAILIRINEPPKLQELRFIESVDAQTDFDRTEVRLRNTVVEITSTNIVPTLQLFLADAVNVFAGSTLASEVAKVVRQLLTAIPLNLNSFDADRLIHESQARLREIHDFAARRKFTRLEPWIAEVSALVETIQVEDIVRTDGGSGTTTLAATAPPKTQLSSFGNLFALLDPLSIGPSIQPASSRSLIRTGTKTFAAQSDIAPQILATLNPAVGESLYQAWANIEVQTSTAEVDAIRVKAGLFPGSFPGKATVASGVTSFAAPNMLNSWGDLVREPGHDQRLPTAVPLDALYDKIQQGSWVVIDRPIVNANGNLTGGRWITKHQVVSAQPVTRITEGYSNRVMELKLAPDWIALQTGEDVNGVLVSTELLHGTIVYAQAETLPLAEEPIDDDVSGGTIELDRLYAGLDSGRFVIVSGERTDIPNVRGVSAAELVMLAGVTQGPAKNLCVPFPEDIIPFASVSQITAPDSSNDRFVIGNLSEQGRELIQRLPGPSAPNQQYCEPVQLAPGLFVDAYVLTAADKNAMGENSQGVRWRIKAGNDAPHTTLLLANNLAYSYDAATVTIYGNVVKATHGGTRNEVLGSGDGSQEMQEFALQQAPLTYLAAPTPAGADSTLQVRVNDVLWHEVDNLVGMGPKDRRYMTSTDDNDQTTVVFGDGNFGARLPTGVENVKAVYRVGIGAPGNVKAKQITSVITKPLGVKEVINPLAASGGAGREDRDQARRNAPKAVMALDRLVSVQDYEDFARTYAGIAKASAARLSDGRRQLVHLTIAGADDIPIATTSDLYVNLRQALLQFGDPYQALQVVTRKVKLLIISARVRLLPDYSWDSVEAKIRTALLNKFSFAERELGQDAYASEAQSIIQAQREVAYVDLDIFDAISEDTSTQKLANLGSTLRLRRRIASNKATIDKNATGATRPILPAEVVYLNPSIADTLILTEISR